MKKNIRIVEVGPRDGLQNEANILSLKSRLEFIRRLSQTGLKCIEVGALVSPRWVPQMKDSDKIIKSISKWRSSKVHFSCLVPNLKGWAIAEEHGISEIAIFTAASETFTKKNINCTISESFNRFEPVVKFARKKKVKVRAYLSTVFECPFEGSIRPSKVARLIQKLLDLGCYEISLGDTVGAGSPKDVSKLDLELKKLKIPPSKIAMHFHNTRGTALANVLRSLDLGYTTFDASVGGLGGCPYAPGAMGNLATEDLIYMLNRMGYKTGVDLKKLIKVHHWIQKTIGRPLPSHLGQTKL